MALVAMKYIPPLINMQLVENRHFKEKLGLQGDVVLSFNDYSVAFQRNDLFIAVRRILAGASWKQVNDLDGKKWRLKNINKAGELPVLMMTYDTQRIRLTNLAVLSPNRTLRLRSLKDSASEVYLTNKVKDKWYEVIKERALEDDEIDEYHDDFRNTPVVRAEMIRKEISIGKNNVLTLVPVSRSYYRKTL